MDGILFWVGIVLGLGLVGAFLFTLYSVFLWQPRTSDGDADERGRPGGDRPGEG